MDNRNHDIKLQLLARSILEEILLKWFVFTRVETIILKGFIKWMNK